MYASPATTVFLVLGFSVFALPWSSWAGPYLPAWRLVGWTPSFPMEMKIFEWDCCCHPGRAHSLDMAHVLPVTPATATECVLWQAPS